MNVRIGADATEEEASAIASALAEHTNDGEIRVLVGDADEPLLVREIDPTAPIEDDLGPTEREERLREEIADIEAGGPPKYKERLSEQGKLFVRDRLDLWFGDGVAFEDGKFAHFDAWHPNAPDVDESDRVPADGLLTGAAEFEGRDVHCMANDFTVKAGSMASRGVRSSSGCSSEP